MRSKIALILLTLIPALAIADEYQGNTNSSPDDSRSINHATLNYGFNNFYGPYGSAYSDPIRSNPDLNNAPRVYDGEGLYRGKATDNPYDPDSVSNLVGRDGNRYSSDSLNNPYGAGGLPIPIFGQ